MVERRSHGRWILVAVWASIAIVALTGGAVGCGGGGDPESGGSESSEKKDGDTEAKPSASVPGCRRVEPSKVKSASYRAPKQTVGRGEKLTAVVKTNCGSFKIALEAKRWPTTVNSFAFLAKNGFYDGLSFERASYDSYLEGGKPVGGAGGPGYSVKGEAPQVSYIYKQGVVAMSQSGEAPPGTAGSRFLIVVAKPWLDLGPVYAPLGKVAGGFDVVKHISELGPPDASPGTGNLGTLGDIGKLRQAVLIEKVTIEKG